ncbi:MAG: bifunctional nuclease family protein [Chloroflexi bacterium]|nr:bifunctional nuclease family protein [Chloroflexota bacterium]
MTQVEATFDALRVPRDSSKRTIILKQKGTERYLPFRISASEAEILASQLQGLLDRRAIPDLFLANNGATESDINVPRRSSL